MGFTIVRGVIYALAFVALWAWAAASVKTFDARIPFHLPAWLEPIGAAVAASGALLASLCVAAFVTRGRGTPAPFDPPREFVATGPYRYVRNPMYVGGLAMLLGAGLAVSSPSILLLGGVGFVLAHLLVVLYEEPTLTRTFGQSYVRYRASVHRWRIAPPRDDLP